MDTKNQPSENVVQNPALLGVKFDQGKSRISSIPAEYILGTGLAFNYGAKKYGNDNYRLGINHSRTLDAAFRHILAILGGEEIDSESGLPHIYHASASLAMYDYMRLHKPELGDIYELKKNDIRSNERSKG